MCGTGFRSGNQRQRRVNPDEGVLGIPSRRVAVVGDRVEEGRGRGQHLRNRVLGRVFHELGLIEHWGSGVQRMNAACRDAGLRPPRIEEIGTRFRVTLYTERSESPELDPIDAAILKSLAAGNGLSTREIAAAIDRTPRATRTRLQSLVDRGLVREIGTSPQDPKRRYFRVI